MVVRPEQFDLSRTTRTNSKQRLDGVGVRRGTHARGMDRASAECFSGKDLGWTTPSLPFSTGVNVASGLSNSNTGRDGSADDRPADRSPAHAQQISVRDQFAFSRPQRFSFGFGGRTGGLAAFELGSGACVFLCVKACGLGFCLQAVRFQLGSHALFPGNILRGRQDFSLELITPLLGGNPGRLQLLFPLPQPVFPAHWRGPGFWRHAQA